MTAQASAWLQAASHTGTLDISDGSPGHGDEVLHNGPQASERASLRPSPRASSDCEPGHQLRRVRERGRGASTGSRRRRRKKYFFLRRTARCGGPADCHGSGFVQAAHHLLKIAQSTSNTLGIPVSSLPTRRQILVPFADCMARPRAESLASIHGGAFVRLIVPFPPDGGDCSARLAAQAAGTRFGKLLVLDNRPLPGG